MPELPSPLDAIDHLGRSLEAVMREHTTQLVRAVRHAMDVRDIASDRWNPLTVGVPTDQAHEVISGSPSRARVSILNSGTVTVYLGNSRRVTTTGFERFKLGVGVGIVWETRGAIWAICDPAGAAGELSIVVEQWDPDPSGVFGA